MQAISGEFSPLSIDAIRRALRQYKIQHKARATVQVSVEHGQLIIRLVENN
ncbi:hypothetical protein [Photorhabdus sp. SF281]|uniref:hypothetical protein n=1 Tax=Photorhabdus sp. SF281 TaxID=3459527 RepID=UPI004043D636